MIRPDITPRYEPDPGSTLSVTRTCPRLGTARSVVSTPKATRSPAKSTGLPRLAISNVAVTTMATSRVVVRDLLSAGPKAAIEAVVRQLAVEEGRFGVRANCVGVGMTGDGVAVRMMQSGDLTEQVQKAVTNTIPLRRWGTVADIAEAVCFLASDRAGFITGQTLNVDGGMGV